MFFSKTEWKIIFGSVFGLLAVFLAVWFGVFSQLLPNARRRVLALSIKRLRSAKPGDIVEVSLARNPDDLTLAYPVTQDSSVIGSCVQAVLDPAADWSIPEKPNHRLQFRLKGEDAPAVFWLHTDLAPSGSALRSCLDGVDPLHSYAKLKN